MCLLAETTFVFSSQKQLSTSGRHCHEKMPLPLSRGKAVCVISGAYKARGRSVELRCVGV